MIRTLHHLVQLDPAAGGSHLEQLIRRAWPPDRGPYREPGPPLTEPELVPRVNHGRWIVDCPVCPGALMVDPEDLRFFCVDCFHEGSPWEGRWIRVWWPPEKTRAAVEELLELRPPPARNFDPRTENLSQLRAENVDHGVA